MNVRFIDIILWGLYYGGDRECAEVSKRYL